jgi:hypothetical protein
MGKTVKMVTICENLGSYVCARELTLRHRVVLLGISRYGNLALQDLFNVRSLVKLRYRTFRLNGGSERFLELGTHGIVRLHHDLERR